MALRGKRGAALWSGSSTPPCDSVTATTMQGKQREARESKYPGPRLKAPEAADKRTWQGVGCRGFSVRGSEMRERGESALRSTEARQR